MYKGLILASLFAVGGLYAQSNKESYCYCSYKCGPRLVQEGDSPRKVDGICFCQQRDVDAYYSHGCHLLNNTHFKSFCDEQERLSQDLE